jgi:hypothetical protein
LKFWSDRLILTAGCRLAYCIAGTPFDRKRAYLDKIRQLRVVIGGLLLVQHTSREATAEGHIHLN